jgi:hypothetical protein
MRVAHAPARMECAIMACPYPCGAGARVCARVRVHAGVRARVRACLCVRTLATSRGPAEGGSFAVFFRRSGLLGSCLLVLCHCELK